MEEKQDTLTVEKDPKEKSMNYVKEIRDMILYFFVVILCILLINQFVGQQIEVSGSSMESTLHDKDHLIMEKLTYHFDLPQRYDIVVFQPYEEDDSLYYIKRVIGLPGETIQIIGSDIYIDGSLLVENYGNQPILSGGIAQNLITLGENEYFLLGDNRNNSKDSRDESIGTVYLDEIIGRAWVRIWPITDFGLLEHQ